MEQSAPFNIHAIPQLVRQYLRDLWRLRWWAAGAAWLLALLAMPAVMLVPNQFEATTKIYVDTQTVLKPLMAGLAVQPDVDQQVRLISRVVVTRPNVEALVASPDFGLVAADPADREKYVQRLMQRIKFEPSCSTNLYSITYRDTDQILARRVVEKTLDMFVQSNVTTKKRDAEEAGEFIEEQIRSYEIKLTEAENRLKDFKVKNFGVSGVSNQDFFVRISTLAEEVSKLQVELGAAEQSREAYRRELAAENPRLPADPALPAAPVVPTEVESRLEAQKKQLDELLRRYTDAHPDVVATRRVVAQLENQKRRETEEKATAENAGIIKSAATSPVYQKIRISLAEVEAQVASLRVQVGAKRATLDQLRGVAGRVPQVEAELAQLNRDYDVVRKNYESLVARRESAAISKKLDESSRLAEFRVVEPARVTPTPVFPGRIHAAAGAVVAALLLALALPVLVDLFNPTFKDAKALRLGIKRPFLGAVTLAKSAARRDYSVAGQVGLAMSIAGLLVVQAGWLFWLATRSSML